MGVRRKRFTKVDTLYTSHQKVIFRVNSQMYVRDILKAAYGLNLDFSNLDLSEFVAPKMFFAYKEAPSAFMQNGTYIKSKFGKAYFPMCSGSHSDFSGSDFRGALFADSTFIGSCFEGCDLRRAHFQQCNFVNASLRGSDLRGCNFLGSVFNGADLRDTEIDQTDFTECDINLAKIDAKFKIIFKMML